MLRVNGKQLIMNQGDYGETITFKLCHGNILENDTVTVIIEDKRTLNNVLEIAADIVDSTTFEITITEQQTDLLPVGTYLWGILWERDGVLVDTLEVNNYLTVERGLANED